MSHDRRARRFLAVMACVPILSVGAGCRSPLPLLGEAPAPRGPGSSVERAAIPELAPVVATAAIPKAPSRTAPEPIAPTAARAAEPAPTPPEPVADAQPAPTPLLDAALRRAEASEEAERKAVEDAEKAVAASTQAPVPAPAPEPAPVEPTPSAAPAPAPEPAPPAPAEAPKVDAEVTPAADVEDHDEAETDVPTPGPLALDVPEPDQEAAPRPEAPEAVAAEETPAEGPESSPEATEEDVQPPSPAALTIRTMRLCRKIHKLGSFEPLDPHALQAGRATLVYCELEGLEYRREGDEFRSNVATRVELIRQSDGDVAWEVTGQAEDRAPTEPADSYVATRITFPASLSPGPYTLRLYQADAASGRTAAAEIPVTIAR